MRPVVKTALAAAMATACAGAAASAPQPTAPPVGPGSLEGVWANVNFKDFRTGPPVGAEPSFRSADGEPVPVLPWAAKVMAERRAGVQDGKPWADNSANCLHDGMPAALSTPAQLPIQFLENKGQITVLYEYFGVFRIIRMDQPHPEDPDPTYMGNAVGHWEGDTLVVDTTAITDKTSIMGVIPHTDKLHIVERIRRTGPDTMEDRAVIEDPGTFSKPWTMVTRFKRVPGLQILEYVCDNNRNAGGADGATSVVLQGGGK